MNTEEILDGLNEGQIAAVKHIDGPCYVVAGPGSGKTKVIVSRTQYMIANGIRPENIVLFTFTNKAAKEIKERVISAIGDEGNRITVGTYHSVCARLLRKYCACIDYESSFTILSTDDVKAIIKKICEDDSKATGTKTDYKNAMKKISSWKSKGLMYEDINEDDLGFSELSYYAVYEKYSKELRKRMSMDFDDLLLYTVKILDRNLEIRRIVNEKFKYVMADEAHDSSILDLQLIKLLSSYNDNLCMIFDDYQSIYAFRGSNINAVINFKDQFKDVKIYNLAMNYRSTKTIVEASKSMIKNNRGQIKKEIIAARPDVGDKISVVRVDNQSTEYACILGTITALKKYKNFDYKDISILYRTGAQSRGIEAALLNRKIPYKIYGGIPFFQRMEVLDLLSFIRVILNKNDMTAFERSISIPKRGIGPKRILELNAYVDEMLNQGVKPLDAIRNYDGFTGKAAKGLEEYFNVIDKVESMILDYPPSEVLKCIFREIKYRTYLEGYDDKVEERLGNIKELISYASEFDDMESLIENISLYTVEDSDDNEIEDRVQMMTMHSSKGLEFKAVIILDAIDDYYPHKLSKKGDGVGINMVDEERRLFYVRCTRAKDNLFIFVPNRISGINYERKEKSFETISPFVEEIDDEYKEITDRRSFKGYRYN